jgi:DNA-binding NarL/FixJ family response regulator
MWQPTPVCKPLTKREKEVLLYVAAGLANCGISQYLGIDISTVEKHLISIYHKLETGNYGLIAARTAAVAKALYLGIISQQNIDALLNILLVENA